jgi:hypothetical protein
MTSRKLAENAGGPDVGSEPGSFAEEASRTDLSSEVALGDRAPNSDPWLSDFYCSMTSFPSHIDIGTAKQQLVAGRTAIFYFLLFFWVFDLAQEFHNTELLPLIASEFLA